ncbi:MAG: hypothetical protein QOG87_1713 [Actinomycetota bacterium]|jgi:hypothetical protein
MADERPSTDDDTVRSDVLRDEDDEPYVVEQEAAGVDNVKGGGEWPDPDAPAEAPAPGSDPAEGEAIEARREASADDAENFKDLLEADPVRGGSKSTPD